MLRSLDAFFYFKILLLHFVYLKVGGFWFLAALLMYIITCILIKLLLFDQFLFWYWRLEEKLLTLSLMIILKKLYLISTIHIFRRRILICWVLANHHRKIWIAVVVMLEYLLKLWFGRNKVLIILTFESIIQKFSILTITLLWWNIISKWKRSLRIILKILMLLHNFSHFYILIYNSIALRCFYSL